jgi:hypothetical protein
MVLAACDRPTPPPAPVAVAANAHETLDRLDTRAAVPLLPHMAHHQRQNMRDHLVAVQEIVAALARSDFAAVERSAARLGSSDRMGAMCTHMGAGAPGFTTQALAFHETADGIARAAKERGREATLAAVAATVAACTGCHATWKQRVVDEPTWTTLTARPAPAMHGAAPHGK